MRLLEIYVSTGKLRFAPVNRRRTWYVSITVVGRTWWFQWWDTERCQRHRILWHSRDRLMCATAGTR